MDVCGAEAAESMLVAVHPWDIHGAHRAGLATAFIRAGVRYPSFFARPDIETATSGRASPTRWKGAGRA